MNEPISKFRAIVTLLSVIFLLYFLMGGIAVLFELLKFDTYLLYAGIAGALASIFSLLTSARLTKDPTDIQDLEIQSLKKLTETTEELQKLEETRVQTAEQINSLSETKQAMEILVRKASLSLFLQEQHRLHEERILEAIERDSDLTNNLGAIQDITNKLRALETEINSDPNVKLLQEIIAEAKERHLESPKPLTPFDIIIEAIEIYPVIARDLRKFVSSIFKR